jgi:DNA-binding transcriptional MerR regulator
MNKLYRSQELSAESGLDQRNIKFYTESGLLKCYNQNDIGRGKHMMYEEKELKKAKLLKTIHDIGITLYSAGLILKVYDNLGEPNTFEYVVDGATIRFSH